MPDRLQRPAFVAGCLVRTPPLPSTAPAGCGCAHGGLAAGRGAEVEEERSTLSPVS